MALSAELEALLGKIEDEKVREATRKQLVENQEGGLRQADYSKKQNELKVEREKLQGEWKKHVDWYEKAKTDYDTAIEEKSKLEAKVTELETVKRTVDPDLVDEKELNKQLKLAEAKADAAAKQAEKMSQTVLAIDKMIKDGQLLTSEQFEKRVNEKADGLANAVLDVWEKQQAYRNEFGKDLPRQTLIDEAAKHQGNIEAAYETLTKADREAKLRKEIEAEYDKKFNDRIRQSGLPIDQGGSGSGIEMGPLQKRNLGQKDTTIPDEVPADGSGRLAYLVAQELIKEGKT